MRIAELMSQPAVTCGADETLHRAAQLMWEHDCGALPVVDAEGRTIGVVTDRDACMAAWSQGRPLHEISVRSAMSKEAFCCRGVEPVEAAERLMSDKRIRRVPVVDDDGRPVGLLSMNDLARESVKPRNRGTSLVNDLAKTLATVCEPRSDSIERPARAMAATSSVAP